MEELARKTGATLDAGRRRGLTPRRRTSCARALRTGRAFAALQNAIEPDGVLGIHTSEPDVELPVDVGKVHYRKMELVGSMDGDVAASYRANTRETLRPGGKAWFVGGAGPMGQMHVIKAIMDEQGPDDDPRHRPLRRAPGLPEAPRVAPQQAAGSGRSP